MALYDEPLTEDEQKDLLRRVQRYEAALEWIVRDAAYNPPSIFNRLARRYLAKAAEALKRCRRRPCT